MNWTALKKFVPPNAAAKVPKENPACPLNGRDVFHFRVFHRHLVREQHGPRAVRSGRGYEYLQVQGLLQGLEELPRWCAQS